MKTNVLMKARRATVKSFASLKAWLLLCLVMLSVAGVRAQTPYAIWCEGNSTLYFTNSNETYAVDGSYDGQTITNIWSGDEVTNYGDQPQWTEVVYRNCTKVVIDQSFSEVKPKSMKRWFAGLLNFELLFEGLENINTSEVTDMSYMFEGTNKFKNIDLSSFNTGKVTTMKGMFKDCLSLTTIDLSSFNTENVTDMSEMFYNCHDLTSLDLGHFNTQKVTDMTDMFLNCSDLTDLDLSSFNTENVTSMHRMFCGCEALSNLNVSSFNTENVTDMYAMFHFCQISSLDLSSFKTDKVENMGSMFFGCGNLKTIFCNNDWNTENVTDASSMFSGCTSLVGGNGTAYDAEHIDKEYARIDREGTPGYFTKDMTPYAIWCEGNTTLYFINSNETYAVDGSYDGQTITNIWSGDEVTNYGDRPQWTAVVGMNCTKVVFDQSFREVKLTSLKRWFARLFNPALQFEGLENLNTSEVTDMSYMFETANRLKNIDLSSFNTGKVTTMKGMFKDCLALTTIDLSSFNTENVTDMSQMFYYCDDLTSLDLSHFNTQKVTDMTEMFYKCQALTDLDLRSFNTENVTSMYYMFFDCEVLSNLNVSSFNTKNVTDMTYMFAICKKLTSLDLSHFDTGKVTRMNGMFGDCKTLSYLDLSNFKTDKVENMNSMFSGCNNLKTIFCNNDWNTENVTDANSMFNGCTSLVGGNGTAYDAEHIDKEYARIDRAETPGYFTKNMPPYAIWCEGNSTLYFTNSNVTFAAGDPFYEQTITRVWYGDAVTNVGDGELPQWSATVAETCTNVVFYESFSEVKPTNLNNWFRGMKNLTKIEGLQYLNTSEATNMRRMFEGCQSLTSLDLSNFDTQKVTSMHSMFAYCSGLTSLDLSSFDTKEVTVMSLMFRSCEKLTSLNLSNFNTAKVTNMTSMFQGCSSLETLDLNGFKTDALEAMNYMFSDCPQLKTIYCDNDWDTSKVPENVKDKVFYNSPNLVGGNGTVYAESHVGYEYARVDREGTPGYFTMVKEIYVIWCEDNATLYFAYGDNRNIQGGTHDGHAVTKYWTEDNGGSLYVAVEENSYDLRPKWSANFIAENPDYIADKCQSVVFEPSFSGARPTNLRLWFTGFKQLTSIEGLENLNTSEVTDMSGLFVGCSSLTSLDLSNFNTEKVENMYGMFIDCSSLTSLDLSSFNTAKVNNMKSLFKNCGTFTSLDLNNFDTEKVENYDEMFAGCYNLKTIYCGNDWKTSNVQSSDNMFYNCMNLVGGNNTKFSSDHVGVDYAHPDGDSPGYFTVAGEKFEYTIGSAMVGTLYLDFAVTLPANQDYFHAYTVKSISETGIIHLKEVNDVIPANTAVIIFGNEGTYKMMQNTKEMPAINDNLLCGVAEATSVSSLKAQHGTDIYVLSLGKDSYINFRKAGGSVKTIPANRAYLPYSTASGAKELTIVFDEEDGEATGIENAAMEKAERTGVFNLSGQRVANPQHGIYIVNGKKVFIP